MPADLTPIPVEGVTALYRRFRPGRFAELRGQDHIVRALRGATRDGRVVHAYLFSGPRGTGKTTTARILAKALNCERPHEGDACGECPSCVAIARGASLDVIELDAASNNGVDDVREITAGAWHQTPGRWKVYIVDEVHQLSKAAAAALLKTLEEPPSHVVFVLATTDPHKVLPTIRSRTQHLEFHLFSGETLAKLLQDVRQAAGLTVDDDAIEAAVRLAHGSARDALSALDQLLATGVVDEDRAPSTELVEGLIAEDAAAVLAALAGALRQGWDPEQLAEALAADVRQMFLLEVAPDVADAVDADRARLASLGERLGPARTVRTLETLGRALRDMKSAPDKVISLEVAVARLARPDLDTTTAALAERLERLERQLALGGPGAPSPAPPPPVAPLSAVGAPLETPAPVADPATDVASPEARAEASDDASMRERFEHRVVPRTSRAAQLVLRSAQVRSFDEGRLTLAVPSEEMRANTEVIHHGLVRALEHEFGHLIEVRWEVDPTLRAAPPARPPRPPQPAPPSGDAPADDDVTVEVESVGEHLITEMFPGAEEIG